MPLYYICIAEIEGDNLFCRVDLIITQEILLIYYNPCIGFWSSLLSREKFLSRERYFID